MCTADGYACWTVQSNLDLLRRKICASTNNAADIANEVRIKRVPELFQSPLPVVEESNTLQRNIRGGQGGQNGGREEVAWSSKEGMILVFRQKYAHQPGCWKYRLVKLDQGFIIVTKKEEIQTKLKILDCTPDINHPQNIYQLEIVGTTGICRQKKSVLLRFKNEHILEDWNTAIRTVLN